MWLRFIEDYIYNDKLVFEKGKLEYIDRLAFAEYLVESKYAKPQNLPINE